MSSSEKKPSLKSQLEEIYSLFQGLEKDSTDANFDKTHLEQLIRCISQLENCGDPILEKLAKYKTHLNAQMTLRHLSTIAVPFERYLKKNIQDDDFIISSQDRDHLVTPRAPVFIVLDNMRSAFNVGSIFRTSDFLGVKKVYLTGYTPTPHQLQVEKAALGASLVTDWSTTSFEEAIKQLKEQNVYTIALETAAKAVDISVPFDSVFMKQRATAFLIGNERFGLTADQLSTCNEVRRIASHGIKNSLNASSALAIALYEWRKQWDEFNSKGNA